MKSISIMRKTEAKGLFEVFVGHPITQIKDVPLELSCKILPTGQYAQVNLRGENHHYGLV